MAQRLNQVAAETTMEVETKSYVKCDESDLVTRKRRRGKGGGHLFLICK